MQHALDEELVKMQQKGLLTIPKKFRKKLGLEKNSIIKIRQEKSKLVLEPVQTLEYPVRRYTDEEIDEFIAFDREQTKDLKKKGLLE